MSRRSTPQAKTDDLAFPVRVKIAVPPNGLGSRLDEMNAWLRDEIALGDYAHHSAPSIRRSAAAIYFRNVDDARRFVDAHPGLELADGVARRHVLPHLKKAADQRNPS